jgi:hypothetical protein
MKTQCELCEFSVSATSIKAAMRCSAFTATGENVPILNPDAPCAFFELNPKRFFDISCDSCRNELHHVGAPPQCGFHINGLNKHVRRCMEWKKKLKR